MIYVDALVDRGRWKASCHLMVDKHAPLDELHAFAQTIGLKREWFQNKPRYPHYDLTEGVRRRAIEQGALPVNRYALVRLCFREVRAGR